MTKGVTIYPPGLSLGIHARVIPTRTGTLVIFANNLGPAGSREIEQEELDYPFHLVCDHLCDLLRELAAPQSSPQR